MPKLHTRRKRKLGISTHKPGSKVKRSTRPKTFKTEIDAKKWAELNGIKDFYLINLKNEFSKDKKYRIVTSK